MSRIMIKGGVSRNTEDGILKASVIVYGKNQWSRICSLLNLQSWKWCQARWYEWLYSTIKKTEWSRDEGDMVLHLATLMPSQWRIIASIVRRTAVQCLDRYQVQRKEDNIELGDDPCKLCPGEIDRYEWLYSSIKKSEWSCDEHDKLLHLVMLMPSQWRTISSIVRRRAVHRFDREQAQKKEDNVELGDDSCKLRVGEIDCNLETKPVRSDTKDTNEDELEMLFEAKSRLTNTQSKMAKRNKTWEKQVEEARRLAALQIRRELRAAGVVVRRGALFHNCRNRGVDYNAEILFEKQPTNGAYITAEEVYRRFVLDFHRFVRQLLEGELCSVKEDWERMTDKDWHKQRKENEVTSALLQGDQPPVKRSKLVLPELEISERDLEQVVKLGRTSDAVQDATRKTGQAVSDTLLVDYLLSQNASSRTRGSLSRGAMDKIFQEAQNLTNARVPNPIFSVATYNKADTTTFNLLVSNPFPRSEGFVQDATRKTGQAVSDTLLVDYLLSQSASLKTSRSLSRGAMNKILQEAQNLTNGRVPNPIFSVATYNKADTTTFNMLVSNLFPRSGGGPGGSATPGMLSITSRATPRTQRMPSTILLVRDKLSIYQKEHLKVLQRTLKEELKKGLRILFIVKNDYDIVVPDEEMMVDADVPGIGSTNLSVENQADMDARIETKRKRQRELEMRQRPKVLKRDLPHSVKANNAILRPANTSDSSVSDLQRTEELTKKGLHTMMHCDSFRNIVGSVADETSRKGVESSQILLRSCYHNKFGKKDFQEARELLNTRLVHGDLYHEAYIQVWEGYIFHVLCVTSQNRYTRASLVSKMGRIQSTSRQVETKRAHMAK